MTIETFDLAIVGGGILGTFHAYHAALRGLNVALIERDSLLSGASVRNFGQVVPSGMNAKWQRYGRRSLELYRDLQEHVDIGIRANGTVYLASDEAEWNLLHELHQINRDNDYPSQLWSKTECQHRYPMVRSDYVVGGLYFPEELSAEPHRTTAAIIQFLQETAGLHYCPQQTVVAIEPATNLVEIRTASNRRIRAEQVIVCSGHDFKTLYPEVFAASDLQAVKLQMLETVALRQQLLPGNILTGLSIRRYESFSECPSWNSVKQTEDPNTFTRQNGIHILFKQTVSGSIIIGDSHHYADAAHIDRLGFDQDQDIQECMLAEARKIMDLESWQLKRSWHGVYSQCKTQDVFQHQVHERVRVITGIGGKGMTGSGGFAEESIEQIFGPRPLRRLVRPLIKLVVFDMAGTTVDEDNIVYKTLHRALAQHGLVTDLTTVLRHGAGKEKLQAARDVIRAVNGQEDEPLARAAFADFQVMLDQAYTTEPLRAQPHADELFEFLQASGIQIALNTGYNRRVTDFLLERLGWSDTPLIQTVVCADDVSRGRPYPDMIDLARQRCGISDPKHVAKIGDSAIDIEEGKNAGCGLVLGITTGAQSRAQLLTATPHGVLDDLNELRHWLATDR